MRMPQARLTRQRKASMKHMPAPVGGLNVRDSIADMPAEDAVIMTNMFPLPDKVMLRKGHIAHATGLGAQVEAVVDYNSATGSELYAATAADIFDVSTAGAVGAAVVTGQTSGKWQHINFATAALQYLYMVNGFASTVTRVLDLDRITILTLMSSASVLNAVPKIWALLTASGNSVNSTHGIPFIRIKRRSEYEPLPCSLKSLLKSFGCSSRVLYWSV